MNSILDCSNYESTVKSICCIFNIKKSHLIQSLKDMDSDADYSESFFEEICQKLKIQKFDKEIQIVWFHGTRVENPNCFLKEGLLPKSAVKGKIHDFLEKLVEEHGLVAHGKNPYESSYLAKESLGINDEGPFAALFKDIVIHAPSACHNYTKCPELVEDIAGKMLGENCDQLIEIYQNRTIPTIVSFKVENQGYEYLSCALRYLFYIEKEGLDFVDAASAANTYFASNGQPILPEKIICVE